MQITEISPQKKKGRYNIFIDGAFYSGIDALSLLSAGFKVGDEVSREQLERYVLESETRSAFDRLARILASPHSKKEVKEKLLKAGYTSEVIERAIKKAEEYGYLSDEQYASMFVSSKPLKSKKEIQAGLYNKGIDKATIEKSLMVVTEDDEMERMACLAEKYLKNKPKDQKAFQGLYGFLLRKGFSSEMVSQIIRSYKEFDERW